MNKTISKISNFIKNPDRYRNTYYVKYHLLRYWQKALIRLGMKKDIEYHKKDTFDWSLYTLHYKGELKESSKEFTQSLKKGDYEFRDSRLEKTNDQIKPVHFNHHLLYETILQLKPESVFELGCGNGVHLHNLQILSPELKLSGIDLLEGQLKFMRQSYPGLDADVKQMDATIPFPDGMAKVDLAFSQAVLMHIHTDDLHRVALANMFKVAKKYVVLYESERRHKYVDDIKMLFDEKKIPWDHIYIYTRINELSGAPTSWICSRERLEYDLVAQIS
jgi:SAM-dependent methyltransferase